LRKPTSADPPLAVFALPLSATGSAGSAKKALKFNKAAGEAGEGTS